MGQRSRYEGDATGSSPAAVLAPRDSSERDAELLRSAAQQLRCVDGPLLLAVSGGADSMLLLHVVALHPDLASRATAAVFDHGTGAHARRGVALVRRVATAHGIRVIAGRSRSPARDEAGWRRQRWRFLRTRAARLGATVVTAHTLDDRIETVVLRILRGAGARGLAALEAPSDVVRPLRSLSRSDVHRIVRALGLGFVDDPSNLDSRFQRVWVRRQLLPALRAVRPRIDAELLGLAKRAADWRADVERVVDELGVRAEPGGGVRIASEKLEGYDPQELAVLWPAIAGRGGLALDRRGTLRLAGFTNRAKITRIPLAGGWEAVRLREDWVVRPVVPPGPAEPIVLSDGLQFGRWRFRETTAAEAADRGEWGAVLPAGESLSVRTWLPGDRLRAAGAGRARRVKRFFSDARIPAPEREGWPVVLAGEEIVWIPGVCRSSAATGRPGGPVRAFVCERSR